MSSQYGNQPLKSSKQIEEKRVQVRNAKIGILVSLVFTAICVVFAALLLNQIREQVRDEQLSATAIPEVQVFDTQEGNKILFTDTGDKGYFNGVEFQVLEKGNWYVSVLTDPNPLDGKAQRLIGSIHLYTDGSHSPLARIENDSEEFINMPVQVLLLENGVSIFAENLNPVRWVIFNQIGGEGKMWTLRVMPKTNELVFEEGWTGNAR